MRIDRVDLIRFGHFVNREIDVPLRQPDFYVVYGENEAGKSTLLRGISSLLFGVPARSADAHSCKVSELRIGATISDRQKSFSFRRRKGKSGTLLNSNEGQIPDGALASFLRELDQERFEQFFGLNHERLRAGGEELLRGKGEIGSALFQAAGLLGLRNLLDGIDAEARELFAPKSRTKVINCVIDEYKQARSEVRRLAISAGTVKQKLAELEAAKETHGRLKAEAETLQQELVRLRRIASNKPDIAHLQGLRAVLLEMETVPALPGNARKQRDEAASALDGASGQIQKLKANIATRNEQIGALPVSGVFKAHACEIEELNAETGRHIHSVADRPKRENERADAIQLAEAEWRGIWRLHPIKDAEELRTTYSRKAEILALITEHARLSTAFDKAEEQVNEGKKEEGRLRDELALHSNPNDPAALIATIEHAKSLGDTNQAITRLKSNIERLTSGATRDLKKLGGWSGTIQDLESAKTPLLTTLDQYAREWEAMTAARRDRTLRSSEIGEDIGGKLLELDRLDAEVSRAGENELIETRARRDQVWRLIRASALEGTLSIDEAQQQSNLSAPLGEGFSEYLRRADEIADLRFANAKDVAIHDRLVKEIDSARSRQQKIEEEVARQDDNDQELRQRWTNEWNGLGFAPLTPAEMKEWMELQQAILDQIGQVREKENDRLLLQGQASDAADQIGARLAEFGSEATREDQSLAIQIRVAEGLAREIQEQRRTVQDIRRRLQLLSLEKRQSEMNDCKDKLSDWSRRWSPLVSKLLLPETSTPEQVGEAIAVLEKVFDHLKVAGGLQYRVKRIGDDIELFERRVSKLIAAIDPALGSLLPGAAVTELHSRLVKAGKAETQREALEVQNVKDGEAVSDWSSKAQSAAAALEKLKALANCDDDQLEAIIADAERKAASRGEYGRVAMSLIERNAAPDVSRIEEEASGYELDSLQAAIVASENRQRDLQEEVFKTGSEHGRLSEEFDRLQASDESSFQAQKAEDALAQIRTAAAQYLRLRLASEILQRAIESYRGKHQGPILKRASELFATLTLGDHCGLTTGFGDSDKPVLVAIRRNKEQVEIEGLSDGTRDQLYFALRLAAIEHHVETVAPCPVVLDDVLINSDDARASAALEVLHNLAARTQVLFFTHHRHLADLGARAGAQIIDLSSSAATALG